MTKNISELTKASIPKTENDTTQRIQDVFAKQKANLQALKNTTGKQRKRKLKALRKKIFDYREKIQEALYADFKKPGIESDISEIYPTISELNNTISNFIYHIFLLM